MTAVGACPDDFALSYTEVLSQLALQTRRVKSSERGDLLGTETRVDQRHETRDVSRVEDDDDVTNIGAVSLDVLTELSGDLGVTLEEVFASHAVLTGSTTRGYDVLSASECLLDIRGEGQVEPFEATVADLFGYPFEASGEGVIETDVGGERHHGSSLGHVRADHASGTYDRQLVLCEEAHNYWIFMIWLRVSLVSQMYAFSLRLPRGKGRIHLSLPRHVLGSRVAAILFVETIGLLRACRTVGLGLLLPA